MNRRDALRKLAAGGAIATTGSVVLSSRQVAHAASPPSTGLSNVPGSSDPMSMASTNNPNGTVTLTDTVTPTCVSGSLTTTYAWRINGYDIGPGNRHFHLRNAADTATLQQGPSTDTCSACPMPYVGPTSSDMSITLRKTNNGGQLKPLDSGDFYDIGLLVTWQCSGHSAALTAEYRMYATYPAAATVEVVSYTVG